jgi:hypothetical protein
MEESQRIMESLAAEADLGELCKQFAINDNDLRDRSARGLRRRKANLRSLFYLRTIRVVTRVHDRLATGLASGEMQSSTLICNHFLMFAGGRPIAPFCLPSCFATHQTE